MLRKFFQKIVDGLKHPIIYTALVAGSCMVIQSLVYKKYLQVELKGLVAALPGIIFGMYTVMSPVTDLPKMRAKANPRVIKLLNPLIWNLVIVFTTLLSIAIAYFTKK